MTVIYNVVSVADIEYVCITALSAVKDIITLAAENDVVAIACIYGIIALSCINGIISVVCIDDIITITCIEYLGSVVICSVCEAVQLICAVCAFYHSRDIRELCKIPGCSVFKIHILNAVVLTCKVILHGNHITVSVFENEIVVLTSHIHAVGRNPLTEFDSVISCIIVIGMTVIYNVVSVADIEYVCITALSAVKDIITLAAENDVVAIACIYGIIALSCINGIISVVCIDDIITITCIEYLGSVVICSVCEAVQLICAVCAFYHSRDIRELCKIPGCSVFKIHILNAVVLTCKVILHGNHITISVFENEIVILTSDIHAVGRNPLTEFDSVISCIIVIGMTVIYNVVSITDIEHIGIAALAAIEDIITLAADYNIITISCVDLITIRRSAQVLSCACSVKRIFAVYD